MKLHIRDHSSYIQPELNISVEDGKKDRKNYSNYTETSRRRLYSSRVKTTQKSNLEYSSQLFRNYNMGKILYDFDPETTAAEKLNKIEQSFYKIPISHIRDVAFLPEQKVDIKQLENEEKLSNLSEKFRNSIGNIRRKSFNNKFLIDKKYSFQNTSNTQSSYYNKKHYQRQNSIQKDNNEGTSEEIVQTSQVKRNLSTAVYSQRSGNKNIKQDGSFSMTQDFSSNAFSVQKQNNIKNCYQIRMNIEEDEQIQDDIIYEKSKNKKRERRHAFSDLRQVNNYIQVMPLLSKDIIPAWIRDREDFLKLYYKNIIQSHLEVPRIMTKDVTQRTLEEKQYVVKFFIQTDQFKGFPNDVALYLSNFMKCQVFIEGSIIQNSGIEIKQLLFVYEGIVAKYCGDTIIQTKNKYSLINRSVQMQEIKTQPLTHYTAQNNVILLFITYEDYKKSLQECLYSIMKDFNGFISKNPFLSQFDMEKQDQFNKFGELRIYFKGEIIQNKNETLDYFSIIYSGKVLCEWTHYVLIKIYCLQIEKYNRWPAKSLYKQSNNPIKAEQAGRWEIRTIRTRIPMSKTLNQFDFFGEEEIINLTQSQYKFSALENTVLLMVSKENFYKVFHNDDILLFKKYRGIKSMEIQNQIQKIQANQNLENNRKRVLKQAMSLIFTNAQNEHELDKKEKRFTKFQNVLDKSKHSVIKML